jgi:peptide/nickel transport system permease protein
MTSVQLRKRAGGLTPAGRTLSPKPRRAHGALHGIAPKVAVLVLVAVAVLVVFGQQIAPQDPLAQDVNNLLKGPSGAHWFGTDYLGRDVFSRLLAGTRLSVLTALEAVGVAIGLGAVPALLSLVFGRVYDWVSNRIADAIMTLPTLVFAIACIAVLGNKLTPVMIAMGFLTAPQFFRVTRAAAQTFANEQYMEAADLFGVSRFRSLVVHIVPKVLPTIVVTAASATAVALLTVSSLMFLGIGVVPPTPTWGGVLATDLTYLSQQTWAPLFPALFIMLTAGSLNVLADAVRDRSRTVRAVAEAVVESEAVGAESATEKGEARVIDASAA